MTDRNADMRHILAQVRTLTGEPVAEAIVKELPERLCKKKKVKLKDGRMVVLHIQHDETNSSCINIDAVVDGNTIGMVTFHHNGDKYAEWEKDKRNTWSASDLQVWPDYRRCGLATEMYAFASACGLRIIRSGVGIMGNGGGKLLPDGERFWQRQTPPSKLGQKPKMPNLIWKRPRQ